MKIQFIGKDPDAGKDGRQEEKGTTEDEMIGWHHRLNGHQFEQTLWDSEGQGSLVFCGSWAHRESNTTVTEQQQRSHVYIFHFAVCRAFGVVYKNHCLKLFSHVFLLGHLLFQVFSTFGVCITVLVWKKMRDKCHSFTCEYLVFHYCRGCLSLTVYSSQRSVDDVRVDLFLRSLFFPSNLPVCFNASTVLF